MASPQPRHFHFCFPDNEGSGAPIGAGGRELHLLPGTAAILFTGPRTFRCSTMRIAETFVSTRPGPALPGITGSTRVPHSLSGTSAASTWQSDHIPDGHEAQATRN